MEHHCTEFCKSVEEYQKNEMNKTKRLECINFESVKMNNPKTIIHLEKCVAEYSTKSKKEGLQISINYEFKRKEQHLLEFKIHRTREYRYVDLMTDKNIFEEYDSKKSLIEEYDEKK
eukprot:366233_1